MARRGSCDVTVTVLLIPSKSLRPLVAEEGAVHLKLNILFARVMSEVLKDRRVPSRAGPATGLVCNTRMSDDQIRNEISKFSLDQEVSIKKISCLEPILIDHAMHFSSLVFNRCS